MDALIFRAFDNKNSIFVNVEVYEKTIVKIFMVFPAEDDRVEEVFGGRISLQQEAKKTADLMLRLNPNADHWDYGRPTLYRISGNFFSQEEERKFRKSVAYHFYNPS